MKPLERPFVGILPHLLRDEVAEHLSFAVVHQHHMRADWNRCTGLKSGQCLATGHQVFGGDAALDGRVVLELFDRRKRNGVRGLFSKKDKCREQQEKGGASRCDSGLNQLLHTESFQWLRPPRQRGSFLSVTVTVRRGRD